MSVTEMTFNAEVLMTRSSHMKVQKRAFQKRRLVVQGTARRLIKESK